MRYNTKGTNKLVGWRFAAIAGGLVGAVAMALLPIYVMPAYNESSLEEYRKIQSAAREGIKQEDIQPGGMRVWRDPFGRK